MAGVLRRRGLLALGVALFVSGAVLLGFGLYSFVGGSVSGFPGLKTASRGPSVPVGVSINKPPPGIDLTAEVVNNTPPLHMVIESIGVDAPVITLGLDANAEPEVPDYNNTDDAGGVVVWYDFSPKPGQGSNAVFAAHVTWDKAPAVFWDLEDLKAGDTVKVATEEGKELVYEVFANFAVDPNDPNSVHVMDATDEDIITLITCGGTWNPNASEQFGGNYSNRTIVQAKLLTANVGVIVPPH